MKLNKFIRYAFKAKKITEKGIKSVSEMPLEKIIVGTTAMVLPGGILISGVYVAAQELKQRYESYVKDINEKNENPLSFVSWLNVNYEGYIKEKKNYLLVSLNDSVGVYTHKFKHFTIGKVSDFLKK